ncbi:MAG: VWA domain-containing protein [Crocinitomicaceae bacterium]|nr:MAG: VWA domain-containing protein [Crocinitomicaceae bacterium]
MKKTISLFLLLLPIVISSCKKEGCTDESAINYSSKAKVDNGTCEYAQDPCSQNSFKVIKLGTGYLETDISQDRVSMLFQVLDQNNKGVDNMTDINRYSLIDYDQEMTTNVEADVTISSFGTIPTQIYTAIVIDISKSVEGLVADIKAAASEFVNLSLPEQRIAVYTFDGDTPIRRINYTTNKTQLLSAINSIPETDLGTSTNLYEALNIAQNELPSDSYTTSLIRQGSILVFTDGKETANPTTSALNNTDMLLEGRNVFVAALKSQDLDEYTLKNKIASTTNNYFLANNINELKSKFIDIQSDIEKLSKSVYWLYYTSPRKGFNLWNIELSIKNNCNNSSNSIAVGTYNSNGF